MSSSPSLLLTTFTTSPYSQQKYKLPVSISSSTSIPRHSSYISCNQNKVPNQENGSIDRRNVLLGLGALYGASPLLGNAALANPVQAPELSPCHKALDEFIEQEVECCPPVVHSTVPFKFPDPSEPLRVRQPAHLVDDAYIAKFKEAIRRMKDLDENDPRNFFQQAKIHCAFCNGAYDQGGYPGVRYQVHGSWLFAPWHRFYIYFWEKILGDLIGDPTFAIPYWSWSDPDGMKLPEMYLDKSSPLYNPNRNLDHYDAFLDYGYSHKDPNPTPPYDPNVLYNNLKTLNTGFIENRDDPEAFMGRPLSAGVEKSGSGFLETVHNTMHMWVGPKTKSGWDMGNLHTAAKDCIFYGHHANVDRLWNVYQIYRDKVEFDTTEWLDATFVFPDPDVNGQAIKCNLRDALDPLKFRYTYESVQPDDQVFIKGCEAYQKQRKAAQFIRSFESLTTCGEFGSKPRVLDSTIRALVKRSKDSQSEKEKENTKEVLIIDDIDFNTDGHARFDVYIAKTINGKVGRDLGELAGSFIKIPDSHGKKILDIKRLGITSLLEDIEAVESDSVVVSLVPRLGVVKVGSINIERLEKS